MTIQELKTQIEAGKVTDELIILKDTEDNFISNQYIKAIARVKKQKINYVDSIDELLADSSSLFSMFQEKDDTCLNVLKSEVFVWVDPRIARLTNLIIVVSKFSDKAIEKQFEKYVVTVPKIEEWMLKDYVYSITEGVAHKDLDWLMQLCGTNYARLQLELDEVSLFREDERRYLFDDLSSYSIFNFTNAITSRDLTAIKSVYKELSRMDVNEFGLLTILLKNFKNIIMVQLNANPTPENTGLDGKQLYAIKKIPRVYSATQLVDIYTMLLDIDRQIKSGELPTDILIDYLVTKILSV